MQFAFDLISDLHCHTWPDRFDWSGQATSPYCVVAGDVCRDQSDTTKILQHLSDCYQGVFFIDGNDEHADWLDDLSGSYQELQTKLSTLKNVVYLQDNVVVINGVAIIGTNGWWGFDLDPTVDPEQTMQWWQEKIKNHYGIVLEPRDLQTIKTMANSDVAYLMNSIKRLQTHIDVKRIVVITHTVPRLDLLSHDILLSGQYHLNTMGNRFMPYVLDADVNKKIHTWCFGHYHTSVDQIRDGVRYVSNCRGRGDTDYRKSVYFPLRIEIDI